MQNIYKHCRFRKCPKINCPFEDDIKSNIIPSFSTTRLGQETNVTNVNTVEHRKKRLLEGSDRFNIGIESMHWCVLSSSSGACTVAMNQKQ